MGKIHLCGDLTLGTIKLTYRNIPICSDPEENYPEWNHTFGVAARRRYAFLFLKTVDIRYMFNFVEAPRIIHSH